LSQKSPFLLRERNPDVLTSIANLSNDEVFTPPSFANQMLDTVAKAWSDSNSGANIWSDKNVKFLDPFTKSGVFLREIVRRLSEGLEKEIPDLQERINHIVSKQVFGIAITQLTALTTRRSVYCSKRANGKHSIATIFNDEEGSIWFKRTEHTWTGGAQKVITVDGTGKEIEKKLGGKCKHCGASQSEYERDKSLESHAYALIHTENPKQLIKEVFGEEMQFDVIIGNPPYQLSDGGGEGSSAIPLYHHFVEQAIKLEPRMLTMIIPARWYSGGKGLDDFRNRMMSDKKLALIDDYPETDMVFPGQNIRGGVCVFLRNEAHDGPATITNFRRSGPPDQATREITIPGVQTFVRYNKAISILEKVRQLGEPTLDSQVLSRNPFGIPSNFSSYSTEATDESSILLYRSRRGSSADKEVFISPMQVGSNLPLVDKIKVIVSKASPGGDEYPHAVIGQPIIAGKNSASTETYLVISTVNNLKEGSFLASYMSTRFFRFLVSLIKNTQNISKGSFAFVPVQKLDQNWTDDVLYKKYGISEDEIKFIESMVRPKELAGE
jgi:site-specific DNA-methyltransferase (adenine-specific)